MIRDLVIGVVVALALLGGGWLARGLFAAPEAVTVVEYAERPLAERDTAGASVAGTRTLFQEETETTTDCFAVPALPAPAPPPLLDFLPDEPEPEPQPERFAGLIPTRPLQVSSGEARLTYWQPEERRWVQDTYRVPRRLWGWGLSASLARVMTPAGASWSAGPLASLRYRRVSLSATARCPVAGDAGPGCVLVAGISLKFAGS